MQYRRDSLLGCVCCTASPTAMITTFPFLLFTLIFMKINFKKTFRLQAYMGRMDSASRLKIAKIVLHSFCKNSTIIVVIILKSKQFHGP